MAGDIEYLRACGGETAAAALADPAALDRARDDRARVADRTARAEVAASVDAITAAALLAVDHETITQRIERGELWASRSGRLPRWQFTPSGATLPGLPLLVAAIPEGAAPASIEAIMQGSQEELDGVTPIAYLEAGGAPAQVAALLSELRYYP